MVPVNQPAPSAIMISTLDDLKNALRLFAEERDWEQFHSPKNLAMALSVEVAELAEHFQWLTQQESFNISPDRKDAVRHELADVLIYLVRLADRLDIDLLQAAESKIAVNAEKYPAESCRGRAERPDFPSSG
jgi:dCTP diphosphatase